LNGEIKKIKAQKPEQEETEATEALESEVSFAFSGLDVFAPEYFCRPIFPTEFW
jgi:hypothetical protein